MHANNGYYTKKIILIINGMKMLQTSENTSDRKIEKKNDINYKWEENLN